MTTDRIYQNDQGEWFFHLRGEQSAGPFINYDEAAWELNNFVQRKNIQFTRPFAPLLRRFIRRAPRVGSPIYRQSA